MKKLILYNWLALAAASLLVGLYITLFEHFLKDKAYLYFIMAIGFGVLFIFKRKKQGIK